MASDEQRQMVQDDAIRPSARRRKSAQIRPHKDKKESRKGKSSIAVDSPLDEKPCDLEALRKARLEYIDAPVDERKKKMKYVGETITREPARKADVQHVRKVSVSKRRRKATDPNRKHRPRKVRVAESEAGKYQPVYEKRYLEQDVDTRRSGAEDKQRDDDDRSGTQGEAPSQPAPQDMGTHSKTGAIHRPRDQDGNPRKQRHTSIRRRSEPIERVSHVRRNSYGIDERESPSVHRNLSSRQSPHASRPSVQRSAAPIRSKSDAILTTKLDPPRSKMAPSIAESHAKKGSSIFSSLLRSSPSTQTTLKKVTCLTCGSEDVPIIKTAKLACTHRMCHDCLRRIFTMSVSDPAHMPPKCCTSEHIPLRHVDRLFDQKFKKTWNRKFQEYTTRNRVYCPSRHCGEWIKPNHINIENGRKIGKCKRCGTRVCCICNNKMHISRECPKDPATKVFVEIAKKEGWQRCFNCSAMVELKEGCNHMTCRCTAEFCMLCGNKWKTCDCPWFNYEAVEADRLEHLNMADGPRVYNNEDRRAPIRYQEEVDRRRHQERRDEALARRMQVLGVEDDQSDDIVGEDNLGQMFGVGNAAEHFLNHDFRQQARNILTGNFRQAARAAEGLLNGAVTGRENPLPPAPFELDAPAANAANQTAQLLRHDSTSNAALNHAARRRSNDLAHPRRRAGNTAANRGPNELAEPTVPLPATLPNAARRSALRNANQHSRSSGLGDLLAGGRSQTADERVAEQRIEDWRSDVPIGEPADGVALV